jgi:hypothetical protein
MTDQTYHLPPICPKCHILHRGECPTERGQSPSIRRGNPDEQPKKEIAVEPDGFFELVKIMQKVQAGEMSCRAGARRFLSDND